MFDPWNPCEEREEPTHFKELSSDLHCIRGMHGPFLHQAHTFFLNIVLRFHLFSLCVYECLSG